MGFAKPETIWEYAAAAGEKKAHMSLGRQLSLGFLGGAYISLGFLLYIRVSAAFPPLWSGVGGLMGAALFPLGLILTLLGGGELLTGNMMAVPAAYLAKRISMRSAAWNVAVITVANFAGALFVAYAFGHLAGLTEQGVFVQKLAQLAHVKTEEPFVAALLSGIGCNWLVALAVWLSYGAEDGAGKIGGIWFPTMAFVAIGFQHVVANMFVIPAAIFAGQSNWSAYASNFAPVFLGNLIGGALFVAGIYGLAYRKETTGGSAAADFTKISEPGRKEA